MNRPNSNSNWSQEDKQDYGRVLRALRELDIRVPRDQVVSRLFMFDIKREIRNAAIKKWREEISKIT
jgi:hypothetical protein